jgi:hypothetical protein
MTRFPARAFLLLAVLLIATAAASLQAQTRTVGVLKKEAGVSPGYTLFSPMGAKTSYLIDNDGRLINHWVAEDRPGLIAQLLPNGNLLRAQVTPLNTSFNAGGAGGKVQVYHRQGTLSWDFTWSNSEHRLHHDICWMPNGNVLMISWELKTRADYLAQGRDPKNGGGGPMWPDYIIEVKYTGGFTGDIVWEWHAYDHLVQDFDSTKANYGIVADNPQLIDINLGPNTNDWMHSNAIAYNPELDQIALSVHNFSEVWVIDHSTTSAEAATHRGGTLNMGGDLLYRWGNPRNYDHGTTTDRKFFGQHDAHWIEHGMRGAGNLLVFNNGLNRPAGKFSSVEEITTPVRGDRLYEWAPGTAFEPQSQAWIFTATPPESMYSDNISSAQRLPNGNTLICVGASGRFVEVDENGAIVWEYVNPVTGSRILNQGDIVPTDLANSNNVFKCRKYPPDYPGFAGLTLKPGAVIEGLSTRVAPLQPDEGELLLETPAPNPARDVATMQFRLARSGTVSLRVSDLLGRTVRVLIDGDFMDAGAHALPLPVQDLSAGMYLLELTGQGARTARMFAVRH